MACGCNSSSSRTGKDMVDLVRSKGFEDMPMRVKHEIECECGQVFVMQTLVFKCPSCEMVYGVTPCSADNKDSIQMAGVNY